jgi:hypothetical protein
VRLRRLPRIVALTVTGSLAAYVFVVAPQLVRVPATAGPVDPALAAGPDWVDSGPAPEERRRVPPWKPTPPPEFPAKGKVFVGITTREGPYDLEALDRFSAAVGHRPQVLLFSQGWARDRFDRAVFDRVARRGMLPMMGWEPWDYTAESTIDQLRGWQPGYRLDRIIRGDFDAYIRSYARGIRGLGYPVAIRFAHEMNGYWYPWAEQANGNRPGDYVKAWRHVRRIFDNAGADNAIWVWSPNVRYTNSTPLPGLYPGDRYVDWVGLVGYYGTVGLEQYMTFDRIFGASLADLRRITSKPIILTEVAATDEAGRKAEWVAHLFRSLPLHKDIIGFIWYEAVKHTDWRIASSPAAASAFAAGLEDPRYNARFTRTMRIRGVTRGKQAR